MATTQPDATGVQAEALQRVLDGRYADQRQRIREVLAHPEFAPPIAMPTAEYRKLVRDWMQTVADEGLTAPGFPAEFGGQDDPGANIAGFGEIALGDLSLLVKFGVQFGLWGGAVQQLGTRIHHERYLRPTASLELAGCFAMTETGHGSNVQQLGTTATYDPDTDEFVVNTSTDEARKDYIGGAACDARVAAVFAQLIVAGESHGMHVLVVPIRDDEGTVHVGVSIEDCGEKMGLNGVDNGRIWFDHVRVPREALLTRYGGVNAQTCRECCGGAGYLSINRFAALKADTEVFTTFEGDNTVLMMLVTRGLLTDYRDDFGELNPRELVMFLAEKAVETVVERLFARKIAQVIADVVPGRDETGDLLQRENQLELFRWREAHITASIAQRVKRGIDDGYDPFEVFRAVQNHAVGAARAHAERIVLEAFADAADACDEGAHRDALNRLCDLYALYQVETDRGYLQEHGRLTGPRCKAVTREVNRLCDELCGDAEALVDAFGIPDGVLRAPIGVRDPAATAAAAAA
jgi:hypothetical protein